MDENLSIALAGNPNSGKTTMFNALTGARQSVGNYPGVTVEKREGYFNAGGFRLNIVDLPGTYSLTAYSEEELVARDYLVNERPRLIIDVIDANSLERNLYLAGPVQWSWGIPGYSGPLTWMGWRVEEKRRGKKIGQPKGLSRGFLGGVALVGLETCGPAQGRRAKKEALMGKTL